MDVCEVPVLPQADGSLRANPTQLSLPCLAALAESSVADGAPDGVPSDLGDRVEVVFRYRVEVDSGFHREAVARLLLWLQGQPPTEKRHPAFEEILVGESDRFQPASMAPPVEAGESLVFRVRIDPDSMDTFVDEATGGKLFDHYLHLTGQKRESVKRQFDLAAAQRCIKALGTFSYQAGAGNRQYLAFVSPTIKRLRHLFLENPHDLPSGWEELVRYLSFRQ